MAEHRKLREIDDETGEPYYVCPSCADDWPCVYAERDALRKRTEGQDLLLRAYRLGTRPPERAFTLLQQAGKILDGAAAAGGREGGADE